MAAGKSARHSQARRSYSACITDPGHVFCFAGKGLVSVFFSLWSEKQTSDQSFSIFAGTSPSWPHDTACIWLDISLGNDFSTVILQMSLNVATPSIIWGIWGIHRRLGGLPDNKTIQNIKQWRHAALITAGKTVDQNYCHESPIPLRSVMFSGLISSMLLISVLILFCSFLLCSNSWSHVSNNTWCGVDIKLHWCHFCCASCCIGCFITFDLERREVSGMLYWVQSVKMTQQSLSVLCAAA